MHIPLLAFLAGLASMAFATPAAPTPTTSSQLATFDDLQKTRSFDPFNPKNNELKIYQGLNWAGFFWGRADIKRSVTWGVRPQSGNYVAGSSEGGGKAILTAVSPYNLFSMDSIFFGCTEPPLTGTTTVPVACKVSFQGYYDDGEPVEEITAIFRPGVLNSGNVPLTKVDFGRGLARIASLEFTLKYTGDLLDILGGDSKATLVVDNAAYRLLKK